MEMVTSRHTTAYEATPQVCVQALFYVGLCTFLEPYNNLQEVCMNVILVIIWL